MTPAERSSSSVATEPGRGEAEASVRAGTAAPRRWARLRERLRWTSPPPIDDLPPPRRSWFVAVAVVQFAIYLATVSRGVSIGDGGEITTAVVTLGVIHPTGYPLFTLLAHLFTLLPIPVEPVVKVEIFNAVCGVGASTFLSLVTRKLILGIRRRRARAGLPAPEDARALRFVDACALFAGLSFGLGPMYWDQVRIPEVYPFQLLLVAWALFHWVDFELRRRNRDVLLACVPMGLACAHHVTIVYMLGASALFMLLRRPSLTFAWLLVGPVTLVRRLRPRWLTRVDVGDGWVVPACLVIGGLPVLFYGYFLWADANTIGLSWGKVDDLDAMWNHMSGRQYRSYMKGLGYAHLTARINSMPRWFDLQFLAASLLTGSVGAIALARRHPRYFVFILVFGLANIAHGVQYSARDHQNYYLPAIAVAAILHAVGVWWLCDRLGDARREGLTARLASAACLALALVAGTMAVYRAFLPERLPLAVQLDFAVFLALAIAGLLGFVGLAVFARRRVRARGAGAVSLRGGPYSALLFAGVVALYLGPWMLRFQDMRQFQRNSAVAYIESAERAMPPGSLYIMGGDDYAFPLWYSQHALEWNRDIAAVNVHMASKTWYRRGYLASHHPVSCDPASPENLDDPEGWRARCGAYEPRVVAYAQEKESWLKLEGPRGRTQGKTRREQPLELGIVDKRNPRCRDMVYAEKHKGQCKCWDFNEYEHDWDNECVHAYEAGGIVTLSSRERLILELIANHIDERDVFERNLYSRWRAEGKNALGWNGPAYFRVSGEYALVNRGFLNQIVYHDDIAAMDPCSHETLQRMPLREHRYPNARVKPIRELHSYRPNPLPLLVQYSVLQREDRPEHHFDDREFGLDEELGLTMFWFERNYFDHQAPDKLGKPIRHGVRVCYFDGEGKRVHVGSVVTRDPKKGFVPLPVDKRAGPGTYTVQACTVGELKNRQDVPDELPCREILLEYDFEIRE